MKKFKSLLFTVALGLIVGSRAEADDILAVLSSESAPYQEALSGFEDAIGHPVPVIQLTQKPLAIPENTQVVAAFGGKAALQAAASFDGIIVYGLAPGVKITSPVGGARMIKIHTSPAVPVVVGRYKELQPALHRLAVLWVGDSIADYFDKNQSNLASLGVELISVRLKKLEDLPDQLRKLQGRADAIWMPPDAALITPQSFAAVREFCSAQHIPFYVPSDGLVEKGATAAVYVSFRELGRLTGTLSAKAAAGDLDGKSFVFPDKASLAVNATATAQAGLKIPPDVLRRADKVVP